MTSIDEEQQVIDSLLTFTEREIMPIQKQIAAHLADKRLYYDETGYEVPEVLAAKKAARMAAAKAGFYTAFCPEELGGGGLGFRLWYRCWEALMAKYGAPVQQLPYFILSNFISGPHEVWEFASPELRAEVLPKIAAGELIGCFGLSEPDAGSDNWNMKTKAVRADDGSGDWIINGMKQWQTWSPGSDFVMCYAVTDPELVKQRRGGITCFYIPTGQPGYKFESVIKLFGLAGGEEGILSFTDCRIPDIYRVGEVNEGFRLAMLGVRHGRISNAARAVGWARWSLEKAIEYAKVRTTFGKKLYEHQAISFYVAECATKLYAAHSMALDVSAKIDGGRDCRDEVSMTKMFCTEAGYEIADTCMQIMGGMGLVNESYLYDVWHQLRIMRIGEGSTEIQKRALAQNIFRDRVDLGFD